MTNETIRSADFSKLEGKLQSNSSFRGAFMNDPVGALRREGFNLSDKQQRLLVQSVNKLRNTPGSINNPEIGIALTPVIGTNAINFTNGNNAINFTNGQGEFNPFS